MKIYIVRHGIAYDADSQTTDSQRALTTQGREKINKIARALKKLGIQPDLILSSPYVRGEQTATILAKEFNCKKDLKFSDQLAPAGKAEALISEIAQNYRVNELVIVGHEPGLGLLISTLAVGNLDLAIRIKKGGVCCLSADDLRVEKRATLEWLLTPKILLKA